MDENSAESDSNVATSRRSGLTRFHALINIVCGIAAVPFVIAVWYTLSSYPLVWIGIYSTEPTQNDGFLPFAVLLVLTGIIGLLPWLIFNLWYGNTRRQGFWYWVVSVAYGLVPYLVTRVGMSIYDLGIQ